MPAISIIIPVYNVEKYLRRCLDSVLGQTFADWQAICVNDGSPDGSAAILSEYAARDGRFVVVNKENGGLSDARNVGMQHATGEYVMFLDSDDAIHPQTMEILMRVAAKTNVDVVAFKIDEDINRKMHECMNNQVQIDEMTRAWMQVLYSVDKIKARVVSDASKYATEHNPPKWRMPSKWKIRNCQVCKNMYRRSLVADIWFITGIVMEDFPWWLAVLARKPRAAIICTPLYLYVPTAGSILHGGVQSKKMFDSLVIGLNYVYEIYRHNTSRAEYRRFCYNFLWPYIVRLVKVSCGVAPEVRKSAFEKMQKIGMFDNPVGSNARRCAKKIKDLLLDTK